VAALARKPGRKNKTLNGFPFRWYKPDTCMTISFRDIHGLFWIPFIRTPGILFWRGVIYLSSQETVKLTDTGAQKIFALIIAWFKILCLLYSQSACPWISRKISRRHVRLILSSFFDKLDNEGKSYGGIHARECSYLWTVLSMPYMKSSADGPYVEGSGQLWGLFVEHTERRHLHVCEKSHSLE
jgi:hypothetical protein